MASKKEKAEQMFLETYLTDREIAGLKTAADPIRFLTKLITNTRRVYNYNAGMIITGTETVGIWLKCNRKPPDLELTIYKAAKVLIKGKINK